MEEREQEHRRHAEVEVDEHEDDGDDDEEVVVVVERDARVADQEVEHNLHHRVLEGEEVLRILQREVHSLRSRLEAWEEERRSLEEVGMNFVARTLLC